MEKIKYWLKNNYLQLSIILLGIVALLGLLLPYERSIGEYRDNLLKNPNEINMQEVDFNNKDVVDISIMENFKVYQYVVDNNSGNDWLYGESLINIILTVALIVSTVLVIVFAILKKPVLTIIFDIILAISSLAMNYDIVSRGVLPSAKYTYGISYYLYIIIAIIVLGCSIMQIYRKKHPNVEEDKKSETKKETKKTKINESKKNNQKQVKLKKQNINILELLKNNSKIVYISIIAVLVVIILIFAFSSHDDSNKSNNNENNNSGVVDKEESNNTSSSSNDNVGKVNYDFTGNENNVEYKITFSNDGNMIIIARNNNSGVVDIEFEVEFYDKDNNLVGNESSSVDAVSKSSNFALELDEVPESYKSYKVYVDVEETDNESYTNKLKATHKDNGENIVVQVKNDTGKEIEYIEVAIIYYKDNKVVGYDDSLESEIKSGRSANFEFDYPYNYDTWDEVDFDEYNVFINEAYSYTW